MFAWSSMLWFASFNKYDITIFINKINMVMEIIGVFLLVCINGVSNPRHVS